MSKRKRKQSNVDMSLIDVRNHVAVAGVVVGLILAVIILLYNIDWYMEAMLAEALSIVVGVVLGRPIYYYML